MGLTNVDVFLEHCET